MDFSPKNCKQKISINGTCWSTYIGYWDQMIDPFQMYKLGVWGDIYAFPVIFVSITPHYCTIIPIWGLFAQQNCMSKPSGIQWGWFYWRTLHSAVQGSTYARTKKIGKKHERTFECWQMKKLNIAVWDSRKFYASRGNVLHTGSWTWP